MCQDSTHRHIFIGKLHILEKLQKYTMTVYLLRAGLHSGLPEEVLSEAVAFSNREYS